MRKAVKMADIAEKLDVSVVTVSKALAGKPGVSEELRGKIVELAQRMGYALVKAQPQEPLSEKNIGVLVSDRFFRENRYYTNLYRALLLASGAEQPKCMMEIVTKKAEQNAALPALIVQQKVDGIIFMGSLSETYIHRVMITGLPCLLLDFHMTGGNWTSVVGDNTDGGCALTRHLLATGRRNIGFVGSILAASSIMDRYLGYQQALHWAGITPRQEWRLEDRDESGALSPILLPDPLPQAFVCSCDEAAFNLVRALKARGLRVPEDVAVCSYDDFLFAALCHPQLTAYRVDVERMASVALELMAQMLRGERIGPLCHVVPGELVVRGSSAPLSEKI